MNGQSAIKMPQKINREQLPGHVQAASQKLRKDQEPRKRDSETLGEKALGKYADIAQNLDQVQLQLNGRVKFMMFLVLPRRK
ncbi:hypothetical protein HRD57_08840 [Tetragenococcus halophilus]|nr:hypothetical protein [Tetragenococcus halophilus]